MNKLQILNKNILKIVLLSFFVMFATILALPAVTSAQGADTPPTGDTPPGDTPPGDTPPGDTPPGDTPPAGDTGGGTGSATKADVCEGLEVATGQGCDAPADGESSVETAVATVINVLSWIVGVAAVIMLIISGFRFVVSSGDSQAVANAKNGIIYAVIGLLIVLFAQVIVQFVVDLA